MNSLALGEFTANTNLHGAVTAPFRGAFYDRPGKDGAVIEDTVDLTLEGTPAQIQAGCSTIETWFSRAREYQSVKAGSPILLLLRESAAEQVFASPVRNGWLEKLKGIKEKGSAVFRMHVIRDNYWEQTTSVYLNLTNVHGTNALQTVENHNDAEHSNYLDIAADQVQGDLPCPAFVGITNTSGAGTIGTLFMGCHASLPTGAEMFDHWLEGEDVASGGADVANIDASGGKYRSVSWGAGETQILTWTISSLMQKLGQGRFYRPILSLFNAMAHSDLWLQFRLLNGASTLWAGPWTLLPPNVALHELPAVQLPPYPVFSYLFMQPLTLALYGRRAGGATTLDVDYLQLTPLQGWRKFIPTGAGLPVNAAMVDHNPTGQVYQQVGVNITCEYVAEGPPLLLQPGRRHRLYLLHMLAGSPSAPTARTLSVYVLTNPRYRRI